VQPSRFVKSDSMCDGAGKEIWPEGLPAEDMDADLAEVSDFAIMKNDKWQSR
jgi:hypothetical protein